MNSNFHDPQFSIYSEHILDILRAKKLNRFFTWFHPFFTTRSTSESCNDPPKVLTEGSMVEYLPVGSQEAPQTIIGQKKFQPQTPKLNSQPSVQGPFKVVLWRFEITTATEGWDCDLGFQGLKFFLAIMVWGASWDPTGRYSTMEPSVSTFNGSL